MPISGSLQQAWGKAEASFDTVSALASTDAFDPFEMSITPEVTWNELVSHVGTLSLQGEVEEKRGGKWSMTSYIAPGALGVAPDVGFLLKHAFGVETVVGGTSVVYTLLDSEPDGLQLARRIGDRFYESINGGWVEELSIQQTGGDECRFEFSGSFASYGCLLQGATVSGAHIATDTLIQLGTGDANLVRPGVYVKFAAEDNGGAGYLVTGVDYDTDEITISPALVGAVSDTDAVAPSLPTQTLSGSPSAGIENSISVDAATIGLIGSRTTLSTGIIGLDKEASANRANRLLRTPRRVNGEIDFYYLEENTKYLGGAWNGSLRALLQRFGPDTAGSRAILSTPSARLAVAEVPHTEEDSSMYKMTFKARQSAVAADEASLSFT